MEPKAAYTLKDIIGKPHGRTKWYEELNAKRLKAKKAGRTLVVLREDYEAYLRSLPDYEPNTPAAIACSATASLLS